MLPTEARRSIVRVAVTSFALALSAKLVRSLAFEVTKLSFQFVDPLVRFLVLLGKFAGRTIRRTRRRGTGGDGHGGRHQEQTDRGVKHELQKDRVNGHHAR